MSISLIILLWVCGWFALLATAARHDGYVNVQCIYICLMHGPMGLLIGPSEDLKSVLPDSEMIIWRRDV